MSIDLLMWLFSLMATVAKHVDTNLMDEQNLARMAAPNLFKEDDDLLYSNYLKKAIEFCDIMISNLVTTI